MEQESRKTPFAHSRIQQEIKALSVRLNRTFDNLSQRSKRLCVILVGAVVATICLTLIVTAIYGHLDNTVSIDSLTLPTNIHTPMKDTTQLTPLGKMKGEINGTFEAFHVAVDKNGQLFINRNPTYAKDRFLKSNGWEPITRIQLEKFEKDLHFIPGQKHSLKP